MLLIDRILGRRKEREAQRARDLPPEVTQFEQAQNRKLTYERVFNTPDGEWVLADLAEQFHALGPSMTMVNGIVDIPASFFADGRREVVMWIMRFVQSPLLDIAKGYDSQEYDPLQEVEDE